MSAPEQPGQEAAGDEPTKKRPTLADGEHTVETLVAHYLRAQTRLRGTIETVEYTDEAQGLGAGTLRCLELETTLPFSCRNISLEKGQLRIAHVGDPCTLKLSCRGQETRATSIRLKSRRPPPDAAAEGTAAPAADGTPAATAAAAAAVADPVVNPKQPSPTPEAEKAVGSQRMSPANTTTGKSPPAPNGQQVTSTQALFVGNSPLNAFEYAGAATTGLSHMTQGSSFGISPHPAGPPQWPGSMPWSAMEPNTPTPGASFAGPPVAIAQGSLGAQATASKHQKPPPPATGAGSPP